MPWYDGPPLLAHLERAPVDADRTAAPSRLPVQCVLRPRGGISADGRSYAGRVASGTFRAGDAVRVLPGGAQATVLSVETADGPMDEARAGASIVMKLTTDLDLGRGDLIVGAHGKLPAVGTDSSLTSPGFIPPPRASGRRTSSRLGPARCERR